MTRLFICLAATLACALTLHAEASAGDVEEGFTKIFNNKDLTGWEGDDKYWSVESGAIVGQTKPENQLKYNTFLILKDQKPGDFELRLSYRVTGGNSGIQYRSKVVDQKKFVVGGYQADIDSGPTFTGINYEERGRGILAQRGERVAIGPVGQKAVVQFADKNDLQKGIKVGEWNDYVIVAQGALLKHTINGVLMSEVTDRENGKRSSSGVLALQLHQGPAMKVEFKNLRIKEFK